MALLNAEYWRFLSWVPPEPNHTKHEHEIHDIQHWDHVETNQGAAGAMSDGDCIAAMAAFSSSVRLVARRVLPALEVSFDEGGERVGGESSTCLWACRGLSYNNLLGS